MRLPHAIFAAVGLLGISAVAFGGRHATPNASPPLPHTALPVGDQRRFVERPDPPPVASAKPLPLEPGGLQRVEPRPPLSELSLALPPNPRAPAWKATLLPRPVAASAGVVDAASYHLTIADIDAPGIGEQCGAGKWPCGVLARTAFRAWLRGRALQCDLAPKTPPGIVTAHCTIGKQDAGAWLVANGWARPAGARYGEEAAKARERKVGIWGEGNRE